MLSIIIVTATNRKSYPKNESDGICERISLYLLVMRRMSGQVMGNGIRTEVLAIWPFDATKIDSDLLKVSQILKLRKYTKCQVRTDIKHTCNSVGQRYI